MKQLEDQTLFTFVEKNANQQAPSATLTSALYSIIFSHRNNSKFKSSSTNQQQRVTTTTFPFDQRVKLSHNSRSRSQHNLITSPGEASNTSSSSKNNNNRSSHLRASSSSIRHSRGNFSLDDWLIRSESDRNLILDHESEFESDSEEPASFSCTKSVNFDNTAEVRLFNSTCREVVEEANEEVDISSHSNNTQIALTQSSKSTKENFDHCIITRENATIATSSDNLSNRVYYQSHSTNSSQILIDSGSIWREESRSTSSLSDSSPSRGRSLNFVTNQQLDDISYEIALEPARDITEKDHPNCSIDNLASTPNTQEVALCNDDSEEEDWVFVGIEDKPKFNSATLDKPITKTSNSITKVEDQSVSKSPNRQQPQSLLSNLYNLGANNSQFDNYIKLYKDLLKDEYIGDIDLTHYQIMALNMKEIDLIRESWKPVRKDIVVHGIQLFRDLFTKFPSYKPYFTNFPDLDLERMHENKRLLRHATKVIETISFVVDSIGLESKANDLNEALLSLVKGHLKRKIGTLEFKNLGIVLVDFICNVNNQRGHRKTPDWKEESSTSASSLLLSASSSSFSKPDYNDNDKSASINSHGDVDDTATMTDALDKLRKLSLSATLLDTADDHSIPTRAVGGDTIRMRSSMPTTSESTTAGVTDISSGSSSNTDLNNIEECKINSFNELSSSKTTTAGSCSKIQSKALDGSRHSPSADEDGNIPLDTNSLVAAWTKLYGVILGLVEREETILQEQLQPAFEAAS